ncbi:MAG TPA: phasin family protein [Noviherbaspirillum sp.]
MQATAMTMPIANLYQSQLEASRRLADAFFTGTEKLDRLVLEATHRAVSDQLDLARSMASGNEGGGANFANVLLQRNSNGAVNYQAEIIRVIAEMQGEMGKSIQQYIEDISTQTTGQTEGGESAAGATSADMTNPMMNMFSMWESAFRDATSMASRSMNAARDNMGRAAESAAGYTRSAMRAGEQAAEGAADAVRRTGEAAESTSTGRRGKQ